MEEDEGSLTEQREGQAWRREEERPKCWWRGHLGARLKGHECVWQRQEPVLLTEGGEASQRQEEPDGGWGEVNRGSRQSWSRQRGEGA